ncbi:metal-sensitive transcriptional regulator [Rhodococcus opacus]|uniref:metal-sensitive transcriptional regulator n=1 Tax=Rhodococcus opacus TaxID=37919 RepID=UPI00386BAE53
MSFETLTSLDSAGLRATAVATADRSSGHAAGASIPGGYTQPPKGMVLCCSGQAPIGMTERRVGDDHCGAGWFGLRSRPSQAPAPVQRTVDRDKYCIEVVTQIAAATKALEAVASMLLDEYLRHCVSNAVRADGIVTDETIQGSLRGDRTSRALLSIPLRKE